MQPRPREQAGFRALGACHPSLLHPAPVHGHHRMLRRLDAGASCEETVVLGRNDRLETLLVLIELVQRLKQLGRLRRE